MAFLHSVLKDVHDKQPYNVGKNILRDNVLSHFNGKLCSGHKGFQTVIDRVAQGVGEYNREVEDSNKKVSAPIIKLHKEMEELKKQVEGASDEQAEKALKSVSIILKESKRQAEIFVTHMNSAHRHIADLNTKCNINVIYAKNNISHESAVLHRCSDKAWDDYVTTYSTIRNTLRWLEKNVNEQIEKQVTDLVETLKFKVKNIKVKLEEIEYKLRDYLVELNNWITEAKKYIDNIRKRHIDKIIQREVGQDNYVKINYIGDALIKEAKEIYEAFRAAETYVEKLVGDALQAVKEMDAALRKDLKLVKDGIKEDVQKYVKNLNITELEGHVKSGLKTLKTSIVSDLQGYVKDYVTAVKDEVTKIINGNGKPQDCGLKGIKDKIVKDYAAQFSSDEGFGVQCRNGYKTFWILMSYNSRFNITFNEKYFEGSTRDSRRDRIEGSEGRDRHKTTKSTLNEIVQIILHSIQSTATKVAEQFKSFTERNVSSSVTYKLGENLDAALKVVEPLEDKLGQAVVAGNGPVDPSAAYTSGKAIDLAGKTDEKIAAGVEKHIAETGGSVKLDAKQPLMQQFKTKYDVLYGKLENGQVDRTFGIRLGQQIGKDEQSSAPGGGPGADAKVTLDSKKFSKYLLSVDTSCLGTDKSDLSGTDPKEGKLPLAIGAIRDEGLDYLRNTLDDKIKGHDGVLYRFSKVITKNLNDLQTAIAGFADGIKWKLEALENENIDTKLAKIRDTLNNLRNDNLGEVITAAECYIDSEADELRHSTICSLQDFLHQQVKIAQTTLTTRARRNYVTSVKAMLQAFAQKVTQELSPLPAAIEEDLRIGFKGFMKTLDNSLEKTLKGQGEATRLQDFAYSFLTFMGPVKDYVNGEIVKVHRDENDKKNPKPSGEEDLYTTKLRIIFDALQSLLNHISTEKRYDCAFPMLVDSLSGAISKLKPASFELSNTPILDGLGKGLNKFVDQMRKAYINVYEGHPHPIDFNNLLKDKEDEPAKIPAEKSPVAKPKEQVLTPDGRNLSKVCLTTIHLLFNDLHKLFYNCAKKYRDLAVDGSAITDAEKNKLQKHLERHGFKIDNLITNTTGHNVAVKLGNGFSKHGEFNASPSANHINFNIYLKSVHASMKSNNVLRKLYDYLERYFYACHLSTFSATRYPCSVFEMLAWCSGLTYNVFYQKTMVQCNAMIKDEKDDLLRNMLYDVVAVHLPAISTPAYDLLVGIAGHGDAATYYGCDYFANKLGLHYPSNANSCFDMLLDVLRRIYSVSKFLLNRCRLYKSSFGWADCDFGTGVQTSGWQCSPEGDKLSSTADCSVGSPLHSYLTDSQRGLLPHALISFKGKLVCSTCSKSAGNMPCLTPLGFRSFSGSKRTGKDLCNVLGKLCGREGCMSNLYSCISCLVGLTPKTLTDVLSFYCQFAQSWDLMPLDTKPKHPIQCALYEQITATVACDAADARKLLNPCRVFYENATHVSHNIDSPDIKYLVGCNQKGCGSFIKPLNSTAYYTFAAKNAGKYLTWLLYVCPRLQTFLEQLKESFSNISCSDSGCRGCHHEGKCKSGKHGTESCDCASIAHCRGVLPVLYEHGLVYSEDGYTSTKTCSTFYKAIDGILNSKLLGDFLEAIDNFFLAVRKNFIWTLLALWSLSLLYLLHIAVVRLDVLRIRSHLRSPSSHRIAAQSLLAAARVKALANVKYFSP
ncbi:hypothetical protein, conserved [Babesia ovata]|uniref:C3H1-type domain-containing protein n=1 Tax=Babesia ovata TaxID=189622 RepID=A0A2H6KJK4_9APIC|nr:uncharacterized protein BOVATA_046760 [Babesia ovata]GBE63183.1 hypothetical protein, conserved [Babesia ovata]